MDETGTQARSFYVTAAGTAVWLASLREAVEDIDELSEAPGAFLFTLLDALGHALFDVELQHGEADPVQCGFGGRELLQDFDAQARLLDHPPDPSHLPFDAVQARDESLLL